MTADSGGPQGERGKQSERGTPGSRRRSTGKFKLGKWAWPVMIVAALYLLVMLINVVLPTGLTSPRGAFNYDWITLLVMFVIAGSE
jgi:hypothetical protein